MDSALVSKVFGDEASKLVLRLKPLPPDTSDLPQAGSWQEFAALLQAQDLKSPKSLSPSEAGPRIYEWDRAHLSNHPLTSELEYSLCPLCSRPVLDSVLQLHMDRACPRRAGAPAKRRSSLQTQSQIQSASSIRPDDDVTVMESSVADIKSAPVKKARKPYTKRKKPDDEADGVEKGRPGRKPKIRAKDSRDLKGGSVSSASGSAKSTAVDLDRQCGVALPNGLPCARSLTCKTHSMSAKRVVPGRSATYDALLLQYQKKNQVKMASLSTAQQLADENEALAGSTPINPDEEVKQVLEGVQRAHPVPLERRVLLPQRLKSQLFRMREMFASALYPRGTTTASGTVPSNGIGGLFGRSFAFDPSREHTPAEDLKFVRPPSLQRAAYLQQLRLQQQRSTMKQNKS